MKKETCMKRRLSYIMACVALMCVTFTACIDDNIVDPDVPGNGTVKVSLRLVLPSGETPQTRAGGTGTEYGELDPNTTFQKYIGDIWILVFREDENSDEPVFDGLVENLKPDNNQGGQVRTVEGTYRKRLDNVEIAVLTNLTYNLSKAPDFKSWEGLTDKEIYEKLVYDYPQGGFVLNERRFIPMWGKVGNVNLNREHNEATLDLYRAVAKMGVQVDEDCRTFTLKKVYVYYDNNSGYCAAPNETPDEDEHIQYTDPDVPDGASQFTIDKPQVYDVTGNITMEQIYLSEVANKGNDNPMKVVVGGVYSGEGLVQGNDLSYYRIDMEDTYDEAAGKDNPNGPMSAFDIIRNHSYIFNITDVDHPGTPTPDKALDSDVAKLKVEIQRYTDEPMRGLPDQYTLTTDKSVIQFGSSEDTDSKPLDITTDYPLGWTIEPVDEGGKIPEWLVIDRKSGENGKTTVSIKPDNVNHSITREARFYVCAGKIKKEITVIQPQPPTANCYAVGNGDHTLIVGIKGNGTDGTTPEGKNILESGDASLNPESIAIIWETKQGLVRLLDTDGNPVNNTPNQVSKVPYDHNTMSIKYRVSTAGAYIGGKEGGNALIGAFDRAGNIIWSWHIWVCPDIIDPQTQTIKQSCVEHWGLTGYDMLDRNLGALSNRPNLQAGQNQKGVAALGLLYQWGRKDPFIGANYSNEAAFANTGNNGLIPVVHYYEKWHILDRTASPLTAAIQHPTALVYHNIPGEDEYIYGNSKKKQSRHKGLSELANNGFYLWGTDKGFDKSTIELGSKTIYDPCPVGYRVPPVNAFVFEGKTQRPEGLTYDWSQGDYTNGGTVVWNEPWQRYNDRWNHTVRNNVYVQWAQDNWGNGKVVEQYYEHFDSNNAERPSGAYGYFRCKATMSAQRDVSNLENNWSSNLMFIPHSFTGTAGFVYPANSSAYPHRDIQRDWAATFSQSYRYTLPYIGSGTRNGSNGIGQGYYYGFFINTDKNEEPHVIVGGDYNGYHVHNEENLTWFPISGVLNPALERITMRSFIDGYPTLSVNSIVWTNSSVETKMTNKTRHLPAAMFLHGGEARGYNSGGRHIHAMTEGDMHADSHFAGSVRCVRDRAKNEWSENSLTSAATISPYKGSTTTITIVSVGSDWMLTDPGAPWLRITPDRGKKTTKDGSTITLTMLSDQPIGTSTVLTFRIAGEPQPRKVTVTVRL